MLKFQFKLKANFSKSNLSDYVYDIGFLNHTHDSDIYLS